MNDTTYGSLFARLLYRAIFSMRHLGATRGSTFLGTDLHGDTIQRIYVINLDRHSGRWHQIRRELARLNDLSGKPLAAITERFSAVDAKCQSELPDGDALQPHYSLAEQRPSGGGGPSLVLRTSPRICGRRAQGRRVTAAGWQPLGP